MSEPPNEASVAPVVTTGKPPHDPIIRIETEMHTARVSSISADEGGRYLVTASDDKTLRVWEISSGRLIRVLRPPIGPGNEGMMFAAAITPDGNTVAGAGYSGKEWDGTYSVYLFDRVSGHMLGRIPGLPDSILHLAFSPDGRVLLITLHGNSGIRLYSTSDRRLLAEDRDYQAETYGASFDKNGRLITASYDGFLRLYGQDFQLLAQTQVAAGKRPYSVSLARNGSKVAVGYQNSAQIDIFSGEDLRYLYSPNTKEITTGYFNAVVWSADGETLYAGGDYRHGRTHLIRKWMKQGQGRGTDLPASSDTILRIIPLSSGGIAYGASDPAIGVFTDQDTRIFFKGSEILDYRDRQDNFLLSPDGTTVHFSYYNDAQSSSRFALADRLLVQTPTPLPTLRRPRTTAPGLVIDNWRNSGNPTLNGRPLRLQPDEIVRCFAIAPDNQMLLLGTVWHLRLFDGHGRQLWQVAAPANVWAVNIAENGFVVAAALADGTIRWYRMADGQELLALFAQPKSKQWVVWTPSGYYDAGPDSEKLLGWHTNYGSATAADFFSVSRFRSVSYRPAVVGAVLQTLDEQLALQGTTPTGQPPLSESSTVQSTENSPIVIISPLDGATVSSTTVRIRYRFRPGTDTESVKIIALVDGMEKRGYTMLPSPLATKVLESDVQIPERDCEVALVLADQSGRRTKPTSVRLKWTGSFEAKPVLYALAIGASNQHSPAQLAAKDAKDFASTLLLQKGGVYRDVVTKVLTDGEATRDSILAGFEWLEHQLTSRDIAAIFIKGQTVLDRNGIPYILSPETQSDHLRQSALPFSAIQTLMAELPARSVLFMDVCQATNSRQAEACAAAVKNLGHDAAGSDQGVVVFSSAATNHDVVENQGLTNGVFTTALIEGLKGKAASSEAKSHITVGMLDLYLSQRIKTLTHNKQLTFSAKSLDTPDFVLAAAQGITLASADNVPSISQQPSHPTKILTMLPPRVTILSPQDGMTMTTNQVTVRYSLRAPSGEPVTEIIGLLDGRRFPIPMTRDTSLSDQGANAEVIREVQLEVSNVESEISIRARNRWGFSEPQTVRIRRDGQTHTTTLSNKPALYALVVGVGRYEDAGLKLDFPAKDAVDFASALRQQEGGLYKSVTTKILTDAEATTANILRELEWLEGVTSRNDLAVVFLAGHGVNNKNGAYYFLPVNAKTDQLRRTGLAFSEIKTTVSNLSGKTLLFADTCHAGNILGKRRGAVDINAVVNELSSVENGAVVFASSTGRQDSLENPAWGNGAFTKALVEALNGKAAYQNSKTITVKMVDAYLSDRVKELTKGQQTPTTTRPPNIEDFPIAIRLSPQ